jgi:hypothetical protein
MTACAPRSTEQPSFLNGDPSYPNPSYPNDSSPVPADENKPLSAVEEAVIQQLAGNLDLNPSDISVVSNESIEFRDSCMGVAMEGLMCAQVVTPGHVIVLEANGLQYEYHTNEDGSQIQPASFGLTWKREGGIAGFCDNLTVFLSGEVYGNQCNTGDVRTGTFASLLSSSEQKQFDTWVKTYGQVDLDASDPKGVADGMTVLLSLYGDGKKIQPSASDQEAMFLWAQNLYQSLYS